MKVTLLGASDVSWGGDPMRDSVAKYQCGIGTYQRSIDVDPYPGYHHNVALVEELVGKCVETFPLRGARAALWILTHEFVSRFNAMTFEDPIYKKPDGSEWKTEVPCRCGDATCERKFYVQGQGHAIAMSGKRIPPIPAMTRYLVTHEYGHAAWNHTRRLMKYASHDDERLEAEYMRMRGVPPDHYQKAKGHEWHRLAGEIIANDFRITVMESEADYWPHDVEHPNHGDVSERVRQWWADAHALALAEPGLEDAA